MSEVFQWIFIICIFPFSGYNRDYIVHKISSQDLGESKTNLNYWLRTAELPLVE